MAGWPTDKKRNPDERALLERCRALGRKEAEAELAAMGVSVDPAPLSRAIRDAAALHREPLRMYVESLADEELDRELESLGVDPAGAERSFRAIQGLLLRRREPLRLYVESLSDEELDRELESLGIDPSGAERSFAAVQAFLAELGASGKDRARRMDQEEAEAELRRYGLTREELERALERLRHTLDVARAEAEAAALAESLWAGAAAAPPPESEFAQLGHRVLDLGGRLPAGGDGGERLLELRDRAQDLAAELLRPNPRSRRIRKLAGRLEERLAAERRDEGPDPGSALGEVLEDLGLALRRVESLLAQAPAVGRFEALFAFHKLLTEAEEEDREEDLEAMREDAQRLAELESSRETDEDGPEG